MSLVLSGSSAHLRSLGALFLDAVHLCSFTVTSYANPLDHDPFPETPCELHAHSSMHPTLTIVHSLCSICQVSLEKDSVPPVESAFWVHSLALVIPQ